MCTNLFKATRLCAFSMLFLGSSLFASGNKSDNFDALKNKKNTPFFLNDWKELRGQKGERGKHGKHGKRGKKGKRGKNGKDGAAFVSAYASVYTQAIGPVGAGVNFVFPNVSGDNNVDTSLAASQGKLVIEQDGDYAVRFTVVPYNSSANVAVLKNGVVVPGSRVDVGPFNQSYTVANECIITLKKGDYIQLQNVATSSGITFNDAPSVHITAEMTIQKL